MVVTVGSRNSIHALLLFSSVVDGRLLRVAVARDGKLTGSSFALRLCVEQVRLWRVNEAER